MSTSSKRTPRTASDTFNPYATADEAAQIPLDEVIRRIIAVDICIENILLAYIVQYAVTYASNSHVVYSNIGRRLTCDVQ